MLTRRQLLRSGLGAATLLGAPRSLLALADAPWLDSSPARPHLEAALKAAKWVRAARLTTEQGAAWPADPTDPKSVESDLYNGSPGVIPFLLELHHATDDASWLDDACAGADWVMAQLPSIEGSGFYEGIAGASWVLDQVARVSGRSQYREAALGALRTLHARATPAGAGVAWNDSTDVISGSAGIGLFLLYAHAGARSRADGDASLGSASLDLAAKAGRRLLEQAQPEAGGLKWAAGPSVPLLYPNFSHGTAGVSYFLASLYRATRERAFLDGALAGAAYLRAVANTEGGGCLVFHHEGNNTTDGKDLYYLGWCHGPVGTTRLFYRLGQITGDRTWMEWVRRGARGITASGIPERRTPGFWNNVSQCCGNTGVAQYFLDLHRATGDRAFLDFSRRVTADLLRRATDDAAGMRWVQAEHRVRPDFLVAQTGFMQGAAGMGTWLLHLDGFDVGRRPRIVFPDSPFAA